MLSLEEINCDLYNPILRELHNWQQNVNHLLMFTSQVLGINKDLERMAGK